MCHVARRLPSLQGVFVICAPLDLTIRAESAIILKIRAPRSRYFPFLGALDRITFLFGRPALLRLFCACQGRHTPSSLPTMEPHPLQPVHRTLAVDYGHYVVVAPHLAPSRWFAQQVGEWIATLAFSDSDRKNATKAFRNIDGERLLSLTDVELANLLPTEPAVLVVQTALARLRVRDYIQSD